jgi:subtilisin family serine protease
MASPVVAGLAGLLRSYAPEATQAEIREAIESTTVNVGNWVAFGRIDAPESIKVVIRPISVHGAPENLGIYANQGRSMVGSVNDLMASDGVAASLETIYRPGYGWIATSSIELGAPFSASRWVSGTLNVRLSSKRLATNSVFMYNFTTGRYDLVRNIPGTDGMTMASITMPRDMSNYIAGGRIRIAARALVPTRLSRATNAFRLHLDTVTMDGRIRAE